MADTVYKKSKITFIENYKEESTNWYRDSYHFLFHFLSTFEVLPFFSTFLNYIFILKLSTTTNLLWKC